MPSVPALGQADLCEFKFSLVYRVSSGIAGVIQRSPVFGIGMESGGGVGEQSFLAVLSPASVVSYTHKMHTF